CLVLSSGKQAAPARRKCRDETACQQEETREQRTHTLIVRGRRAEVKPFRGRDGNHNCLDGTRQPCYLPPEYIPAARVPPSPGGSRRGGRIVSSHSAWPPLQGVIFDMDGVLVDSEPFIKEAGVRLFAEKGFTVRGEDFTPFVGTGEDHLLGGVAEKYGLPFDARRDKARTYAIYLELIRGRLRPLPGVFSFLDACRARRLKVAVASSADAIKVEGNLHEIGLPPDAFDALVNGSQVERKKPAPDIF